MLITFLTVLGLAGIGLRAFWSLESAFSICGAGTAVLGFLFSFVTSGFLTSGVFVFVTFIGVFEVVEFPELNFELTATSRFAFLFTPSRLVFSFIVSDSLVYFMGGDAVGLPIPDF